ncbi:MAG TPA: hypothetical protein VKU00_05530 [Chthonomonadaceae bacterium]|nr:hypothetical protein [Chthonomonadaceae bacterium]
MRYGKLGLILTAAVLMTAVSVTSFAQGQPGGRPGGAPGGGFGGGQGGGQRRGGGMTVASVPAGLLASELKLSADQKSKIKSIQDKMQADLKPLTPAPGSPRPDQQTAQANREKRQQIVQQATQGIEGILTADQKAKVPGVIQGLQPYRAVNIPIGALEYLNLTSDQKTKIAKIAADAQTSMQSMRPQFQAAQGDQTKMQALMQQMQKDRQQDHDKAVALLTSTQKSALDKYMKEHPQPTFGGPGGGFGGGGRGNRGGGAGGAGR